jgi:hypothetical protein
MENKLYHLNPNSWGQEYYVMAESKEKALEYIVQTIISEEKESRKKYLEIFPDYEYVSSDANKFKNCSPGNLPDKYTLDEYGPGQVIISEVA